PMVPQADGKLAGGVGATHERCGHQGRRESDCVFNKATPTDCPPGHVRSSSVDARVGRDAMAFAALSGMLGTRGMPRNGIPLSDSPIYARHPDRSAKRG